MRYRLHLPLKPEIVEDYKNLLNEEEIKIEKEKVLSQINGDKMFMINLNGKQLPINTKDFDLVFEMITEKLKEFSNEIEKEIYLNGFHINTTPYEYKKLINGKN